MAIFLYYHSKHTTHYALYKASPQQSVDQTDLRTSAWCLFSHNTQKSQTESWQRAHKMHCQHNETRGQGGGRLGSILQSTYTFAWIFVRIHSHTLRQGELKRQESRAENKQHKEQQGGSTRQIKNDRFVCVCVCVCISTTANTHLGLTHSCMSNVPFPLLLSLAKRQSDREQIFLQCSQRHFVVTNCVWLGLQL